MGLFGGGDSESTTSSSTSTLIPTATQYQAGGAGVTQGLVLNQAKGQKNATTVNLLDAGAVASGIALAQDAAARAATITGAALEQLGAERAALVESVAALANRPPVVVDASTPAAPSAPAAEQAEPLAAPGAPWLVWAGLAAAAYMAVR